MIVFHAMPDNTDMASRLARKFADQARVAEVDVHAFPDGESLVRVQPPAPDAEAVLVCTLDHPDTVTVPLLMAAATLRDLGARRVGLVAPYLAYMRQDKRFQPGQAVSARIYASLLSANFDWLVTVDPHLHRIHGLDEIYAMRSRVVHAAPAMAAWIGEHVDRPVIIGPDAESEQWARDVAERVGAPVAIVEKTRLGDTDVQSSIPRVQAYPDHTPVLLDDIISSGRTLAVAIGHLHAMGMRAPYCVAVHGLMAGDARQVIEQAGVAGVTCTNTVNGQGNVIDVSDAIAEGVRELLAQPQERQT
jgi:ribose-phosphate pyrophosphokinase